MPNTFLYQATLLPKAQGIYANPTVSVTVSCLIHLASIIRPPLSYSRDYAQSRFTLQRTLYFSAILERTAPEKSTRLI